MDGVSARSWLPEVSFVLYVGNEIWTWDNSGFSMRPCKHELISEVFLAQIRQGTAFFGKPTEHEEKRSKGKRRPEDNIFATYLALHKRGSA